MRVKPKGPKREAKGKPKKRGFVPKGQGRYDRHDAYYRRAKQEGYLARSVYKLQEIDRDFHIIRPGDFVLDLGAAPGSWLQYAEERVRQGGGQLVGIDLLPVRMSFGPHVKVLEGDVFETPVEALRPDEAARRGRDPERPFDVVLSDMAPNTTGIKSVDQARSMALAERALKLAGRLLAPGGRFVVKVFEGGDFKDFLDDARRLFDEVKVRRPKGTRAGSIETYVIALSRKAEPMPAAEEETP